MIRYIALIAVSVGRGVGSDTSKYICKPFPLSIVCDTTFYQVFKGLYATEPGSRNCSRNFGGTVVR